jgi:ribosomal protein L21
MPNVNPTPATPSTPVSPTSPAINPTGNVAAKPQPTGNMAADPKTAPAVPETFEVKINGKVEKKTRQEIIDAYQLRQLSDQKRAEAERVLTEYKKLQQLGAQDPIKLMRAMGIDFDGVATKYLAQKAEESMKDPAVREKEKLEAENKQYKEWVENQKANMEKATREKAIHIQIAQDLMVFDKAKQPLSAKEALPKTYARLQAQLQGLASKMEGEALVKWLGEDVAKKIRKYDLTQLKAKRSAPVNGASVKPQKNESVKPSKPYKTWSQFKAETLDKIQ